MTEREFTVTTRDETTGSFREEWMSGKNSDGSTFEVDMGVGTPTLTLNIHHGDRVVRESIDLRPMLTEWAKAISKEMKKEQVHYGDD
jgi:hypothetical protein